MEQHNVPSNPAQVTKELVKASYNIELTRLNYQKVLQATESIVWTRENIEQELLEPAKFVAGKLTEKKETDKRPHIDAGKIIQNEYNSVFNPLNDVISRKAAERKTLADQMQKEQDEANAEIARQNAISFSLVSFIQTVTNEITESTTDSQIVLIEKKIGSELSRKSYYGDLWPTLKIQCEALKPLIVKQKEYIRLLASIDKGQNDAMAKGDDSKAVDLRQQAEDLKEIIEEGKIKLQEKAFEQVENSGINVGMPVELAPNATRTTWKWRVDDLQLLYKKMPSLVLIIPNKEAIDAILKNKRELGELDGKREEKLFGITFYQDKSYK